MSGPGCPKTSKPSVADRNRDRTNRNRPVVSSSPTILKLLDEAARIARSDVGVLVCGESGTGKELLARMIHESSHRSGGPFIAVNCAGLPRDLVEAELFGVERGAATGVEARPGRFELADEGTLLLDEIGDMSPQTQAMILRALEEGVIYRVGSVKPRPVALRVVAATNRNVNELMRNGQFRDDLYYRIASWVCHLPPLRQRKEDIPHLVAHFLSLERSGNGRPCSGIARDAMGALVRYDWPGNIRQLKNELALAVALAPEGCDIEIDHLSPRIRNGPMYDNHSSLRARLKRVERQILEQEIEASSGNLATVARRLDVPLSTLYRRIKMLGVSHGSRSAR